MPYISQTLRNKLDPLIAKCPQNYETIYWIAKGVLGPAKRYADHARVLAHMVAAACEWGRRNGEVVHLDVDILACSPNKRRPRSVLKLIQAIKVLETGQEGAVNYCITLTARQRSDIELAIEAYYLVDMGKYEEKAIKKNGDIPRYATAQV